MDTNRRITASVCDANHVKLDILDVLFKLQSQETAEPSHDSYGENLVERIGKQRIKCLGFNNLAAFLHNSLMHRLKSNTLTVRAYEENPLWLFAPGLLIGEEQSLAPTGGGDDFEDRFAGIFQNGPSGQVSAAGGFVRGASPGGSVAESAFVIRGPQ